MKPKSENKCAREGIRLIVALAKIRIFSSGIETEYTTSLCTNARRWIPNTLVECESDVHGIELNSKGGFRYCSSIRWLLLLRSEDYSRLNKSEEYNLENKNYFDALKSYIINLRMLRSQQLSTLDNKDASNEDKIKLSEVDHSLQNTKKTLSEVQQSLEQLNKKSSDFETAIGENNKELSEMRQVLSQFGVIIGKNITIPLQFSPPSQPFSNNLLGIISIIISLIIGLVLLFLICQIRQIKNYLNQRNASKTDTQLMTPLQPVEIVEKRRENEEATKLLLKD